MPANWAPKPQNHTGQHKTERKKPDAKLHIPYDSVGMKCPEQAHSGDKADQWLLGLGVGAGRLASGHKGSYWKDKNAL